MWSRTEILEAVIPRMTLYRRIAEGDLKSRMNGIGPNGKPIREVYLFSLPDDLQIKALELLRDTEAEGGEKTLGIDLTTVPDHHRDHALARIKACRKVDDASWGEKTAATKEAAEELGVTPAHLYRIFKRYQQAVKSGENLLSAMLPKWKGSGRPKALPDHLIAWVEKEYLKPTRPSGAKVHRGLCKLCKERGVAEPSYATVRRIIAEIPEGPKVRFRRGKETWRKKSMPKVRRDYTTLAPLELVCGDHHQFDCFVLWRGKPIRPWLTAWEDLRTRTILGRAYSVQPNSWVIARALRHAILPKLQDEGWPMCGVPKALYVDNGKDFRSHHLEGVGKVFRFDLNTQVLGVLAELGIGVEWAVEPGEAHEKRNRHAKAYQPWSKPVERWFGTLAQDFTQGLPGWCGNKPENRPEKLAGEIASGKLLAFEEFCKLADRWIVEEYHQRPHSGQGMRSKSPLQEWSRLDKEIRVPLPRTLDLLLMKVEGRTIHPSGIRLNNYWYWDEKLGIHVGERVNVRYSPEDVGEILVFHGTNFLCKAREAKLYSYHAEAEDLKTIQAEQRRAERVAREFREIQSAKALEPDDVDRHFARQERLKAASARRETHEKQTNIITRLDAAAKKVEMAEEPKKSRLAAWPHELEEKSA